MTVTHLLAGTEYLRLRAKGRDTALHQRVQAILRRRPLEQPLQGAICGAGPFPNSIIAFAGFETAADYDQLIGARDTIYLDTEFAGLGIEKRFRFIGHVTLGHIESADPSAIDEALEGIRQVAARPRFIIDGLGLFIFSDMSHCSEAV